MADLVRRTGVPAATIHHYLRLGLLPPPRRSASNRFLYDDRHVLGLRLIRTLRERRGLSLKVIRRILPDLIGLDEGEAFRPEMWDRAVGLRTSRTRRAPRARLLDAAVHAFSRRGYGDVNVDDICRAARVAKGSFYRHFRSKEELFGAVADSVAQEVAESFAEAMATSPGLPDRTPEERAGGLLARALEPRLSVFLDLFARAAQRRPGYPAAAGRVYRGLAYRVGEILRAEDPLAAGDEVFGRALAALLGRVAEPARIVLSPTRLARP